MQSGQVIYRRPGLWRLGRAGLLGQAGNADVHLGMLLGMHLGVLHVARLPCTVAVCRDEPGNGLIPLQVLLLHSNPHYPHYPHHPRYP